MTDVDPHGTTLADSGEQEIAPPRAAPRRPNDPAALADAFLQGEFQGKRECPTLCFYRDEWWAYRNGRYTVIPTREMQSRVNRAVERELARRPAVDRQGFRLKTTAALVNNVLQALQGRTLVPGGLSMPAWIGKRPDRTTYIAMGNGLLDLDALLAMERQPVPSHTPLRSHTPLWFTAVCLPYDYDPAAQCPRFLRFLDEMFAGDQAIIALVQEWFGYCLTSDTSFHKFLILVGEGANGKGVLTRILTELVGRENASSVGLDAFGRERFGLTPTIHKLVNVCAEVEGEFSNEGRLKEFVAGDPITIDRKFKEHVTVEPTARLVFSTNNPPKFRDSSFGMVRRAILIPCHVVIPEADQNRHLAEELVSELPGIFNWAIEGRRRLGAQGRFTEPEVCRVALLDHMEDSHPEQAFLREHYATDPAGRVLCEQVYAAYRAFCHANGHKALSESVLGTEVRRTFKGVKRKRDGTGRPRKNRYVGLGLVAAAPLTTTTEPELEEPDEAPEGDDDDVPAS